MNCTKCGAENREGAKFCNECAAPIEASCPKCGSKNKPSAKFCDECGMSLGSSAPASARKQNDSAIRVIDSAVAENLDGERKYPVSNSPVRFKTLTVNIDRQATIL